MSDILVSSFKNAKDVHPVNATLESILDAIRSTRLQAQIGRLRHTLQTAGKAAYNAQKIALPAVTFGGTFTRRAADCLHAASGYMICDVDGVLDAQGVKELVAGDEHVKAAFISPSGVGVKFLVAVPVVADATAFSRMFPVVSNYFLEVYNVILDRQGSDISRLCFLSHDPAMIINDDHNIIPFEVDLTSDTADAMPSDVPRMLIPDATRERWLSWKIDSALNIITQSGPGGLHAARLKAGNLLGGVVSGFGAGWFSAEDAFQTLWPAVAAKTATPKQAEQDVRDGITHGQAAPFSAMDMQAEFEEWKARHPLVCPDALPPAHKTKKSAGKANVIRAALNQYTFALNELTDRIMVNSEPLTDEMLSVIYCELVDTHPSCSTELLTHVIRAEAAQHRYHPVKDYLTALRWEGMREIEKLASYFSDEDGVFGLYLRKWLIGAVAKAFSGKQNPVLVLVGEQGMGKGFLAKWLCPVDKTYIESPIIPDNNDNKLRLTDRFVWEVSELGSTTHRADVDALKWFLTLESVVARRAYGRFDTEKPALASFIGTINPDGAGFLMDSTGNRRFRPVTLTRIDKAYATACNLTQIWAEAVDAYRRGETSDLHDADEMTLRQQILPKSQVVNIMVEMIDQDYARLSPTAENYMIASMSSAEILQHLYTCGYHGRNSKADAMDLAQAMKGLGFEKVRTAGGRKYVGIVGR